MDKYDVSNDHYCLPGSGVLKNKLGILSMEGLEAAEREITGYTHRLIEYSPPPYSLDTLKRIHFQLFSPLYDWAGEQRNVDISKGGTRFCTNSRIEAESGKRFDALRAENWLKGLGHAAFCERLAEHYCELNMIHPFREGNGRAQRVLFEHIALSAGFELNWTHVEPQEWLAANIEGVRVDYRRMCEIFKRIVTPLTADNN
ncbi:Fic/DOC family protein [Lysobacter enzymogenes]|uniref:Fic/DOC family protein n=1 Tax=Lysobacter enzymogenes TaxID=69 RepID=UPI0019D0B283|nr:Fic family protein [Lysobacter enzymogenes]